MNSPNLDPEFDNVDTTVCREEIKHLVELVGMSSRPLLLIGGGMDYKCFNEIWPDLEAIGIPIATTWNACDYVDFNHPLYAGRPNTYGMRSANAIIQQADLVITFGARLGLQQTGFAWHEFVPKRN